MVFVQFNIVASSASAGKMNPVIIQVPLYGKYRTQIISIQYYGTENTVCQMVSRQLAMPIVGADVTNQSRASRYPVILIGTENSANPPVTGTFPWEFTTDWDGRFEIILLDLQTGAPLNMIANSFNFIINMNVEPVDLQIGNPPSNHLFSQLPSRTFEK
jgi:hypothetical protein